MKVQLIGRECNKGFATLEVLIAFLILILSISAVMMVFFGNQSIAIDSQISNEALYKTQALLEKARADSREDFNLVNSSSTIEISGPLTFTKKINVAQNDLFSKAVTAEVSWQTAGRNLSTTLSTIVTKRDGLEGGDTCSSVLTGDWKNPQIESTINFSNVLTDVDAYQNKLYVTAGSTTEKTDPTFFVFDINNPSNPNLLSSLDNDIDVKNGGLNSVAVTTKYAFVASKSSYTRGQMQVVDLDLMSVVKTFKVPIINSSGSSNGLGNSIFYKNKIVYLGLTKSTKENEFNMLDVSDPLSPLHVGQYPIGNAINDIFVRDDYAYIASPNTQELQIFDISNFNDIESVGSFNSSSGAGNGKSIYLIGGKLYLGKTTGVGLDFHVLDNVNPASTLSNLGGIDVGTGNSINKVIVRDYLAFLLTNKDLQIFNISDLSNIKSWGTYPLPGTYNSSNPEPSMDCEGNRIFISSNNESGQGSIYIIKPGN